MLAVAWINGHLIQVMFCLNCLVFLAVLKNHLFSQTLESLWSSYHYAAHHGGSHCLTHSSWWSSFPMSSDSVCVPLRFLELEVSLFTPPHSLGLTLYTTAVFSQAVIFTPPSPTPTTLSLNWVSFLCFWEKRFVHRKMGVTCQKGQESVPLPSVN